MSRDRDFEQWWDTDYDVIQALDGRGKEYTAEQLKRIAEAAWDACKELMKRRLAERVFGEK